MEITVGQYEKIRDSLPFQHANVHLSNLTVLNAFLLLSSVANGRDFPGISEADTAFMCT
jgi:hypothetical protein